MGARRHMRALAAHIMLAAIAVIPVGAKKGVESPTSQRAAPAPPLSFEREMLAGAVARAAAQCCMYPADVMKTLAQARSRRPGLSIWEMGVGKLLSGAVTTSFLALPAGALQFSIFPLAKRAGRNFGPLWLSTAFLELFAAGVAAFVACFVQTPQEIVKQRLQTGIYPTFWKGVVSLSRTEGLRGFYSGFSLTVARNTPTVCVSFTAFSRLKGAYEDRFEKKPDSMTNFALGALAAGVTRMLREEGTLAMFKGLLPRLLYVAPFGAVQFAVNEWMRAVLRPQWTPAPEPWNADL